MKEQNEIYIFRSGYLPKFDRLLLRDGMLCYKGKLKEDLSVFNAKEHTQDCSFCKRETGRKCPEYYVCFNRIQEVEMLINWLESEMKK